MKAQAKVNRGRDMHVKDAPSRDLNPLDDSMFQGNEPVNQGNVSRELFSQSKAVG